eukprot:scaffold5707_cov112-Cylindrotheca_fusiformis.AAC.12
MKRFSKVRHHGAIVTQTGGVKQLCYNNSMDDSEIALASIPIVEKGDRQGFFRRQSSRIHIRPARQLTWDEARELSESGDSDDSDDSDDDDMRDEETGFELKLSCNRRGTEHVTIARAEFDVLNRPPPLQTRLAKLKRFFSKIRRQKLDVVTIVEKEQQRVIEKAPSTPVKKELDDSLWTELFDAAKLLVQLFREEFKYDRDDRNNSNIDSALHTFQQHAERLGVEERELVRTVQEDKRSVNAGLIGDDGTIITYTTGNQTTAFSEDDAGTILTYTTGNQTTAFFEDDGTIMTYTTGNQTSTFFEDDDDDSMTSFSTKRPLEDSTVGTRDDSTIEDTSQKRERPDAVIQLLDVFDLYFSGY